MKTPTWTLSSPGGEPFVDCVTCGRKLPEPVDNGERGIQVCTECGADQVDVGMTEDELKQRVASIIAMAADDEEAHAAEDSLHLDVIRAFCPEWVVAEIARLSAANFSRWCA